MTTREHDSGRGFVVVASRLPVDRAEGADGGTAWRPSPGGLVAALEPVMRKADGVWVGWTGDAGPEPGAFQAGGLRLVGVGLSRSEEPTSELQSRREVVCRLLLEKHK